MHYILVNDDNTLFTSQKERIMQRSKLVDTLIFLVNQMYQEHDMSRATVLLEYLLPVSKKYGTKILRKVDETRQEYLQYMLPENDEIDTELTSEPGKIELQLTFIYVDLDVDGNPIQRVRKTSATTMTVIPISNWSDIVPDGALSVIDQRIIKTDAQIKALDAYIETIGNNMVDNIKYDDNEETLYLTSKDRIVGSKVSVRDIIDDGIPVVDMDSISGGSNSNNGCSCGCDCWDNVVEFGYEQNQNGNGCNCGCEDNVVEFDKDTNVVNF